MDENEVNPMLDQATINFAIRDLTGAVLGDPVWVNSDSAVDPLLMPILDAAIQAFAEESDGGLRITAGEGAAVLALPRPGSISEIQVQSLLARLDGAASGEITPEELRADLIWAAATHAEQVWNELVADGWQTLTDGYRRTLIQLTAWAAIVANRQITLGASSGGGGGSGGGGDGGFNLATGSLLQLSRPVPRFYLMRNFDSGREQRGEMELSGVLPPLILEANSFYGLYYYAPESGRIAMVYFYSADTGAVTEIPPALFLGESLYSADADGDGLSDFAELIVGTNPLLADSDEDGLADEAELLAGSDPRDGLPLAQGTLAAVQTQGAALDVTAFNQTALIAEGTAGVSVLDTVNAFNPIRTILFDTPGNAVGVSFQGGFAAVADGPAGLGVIDLNNPAEPLYLHQVPVGGTTLSVVADGRFAWTGTENGLVALVNLITGEIIAQQALGTERVMDLLLAADHLYAYTPGRLHVLDPFALTVLHAVDAPGTIGLGGLGKRLRLAAGNGLLYTTHSTGFNVFSLANPALPVRLRQNETQQFGWKQLQPNGSGLGIAAVGLNSSTDGPHDIYLHSLEPGGTNSVFLASLVTPGVARALSLYYGLAYIADDTAGLQVMNYLAADTFGVPPTIELEPSFAVNPPTAEETSWVRVEARVTDDVQVRNVEFYVDGVLVANDGNFPFEGRFLTPALTVSKTSFTLRARAFDTGRNSTWSDEWIVTLAEDATPPFVRAALPRVGSAEVSRVTAFFSEPVAPASVVTNQTFRLFAAGPDEVPGTGDDVPVMGAQVEVGFADSSAALVFANPLPNGLYRAELTTGITDLAGLGLNAPFTWDFRVGPGSYWAGGANGAWNSPANWSTGVVPGPDDMVYLDVFPNQTIRVGNTTINVRGIVAFDPLEFQNCTVSVSESFVAHQNVTLNGGTLRNGTVELVGGVKLVATGNGLLQDLTVLGAVTGQAFNSFRLQGNLNLAAGMIELPQSTLNVVNTLTITGG
ncbi:MAG TPA: Ig-like domain-containing protein, partial [Verrucomicrobiae bacterium]|nr:Ig-like domain-containing protein [Verrucomicrobiae bacterium]